MVPGTGKKGFFLRPFLPSSKSKIRSHKENENFFLSYYCILLCNNPLPGLLQPCTMVVTVSITRLNTRLLQPCFMVATTLYYNLVTTLLHPCNKVVISVWVCVSVHSRSATLYSLGNHYSLLNRVSSRNFILGGKLTDHVAVRPR